VRMELIGDRSSVMAWWESSNHKWPGLT